MAEPMNGRNLLFPALNDWAFPVDQRRMKRIVARNFDGISVLEGFLNTLNDLWAIPLGGQIISQQRP
jgi:hypothetical protein